MKIAITGAQGNVGRDVVKFCSAAGHHTVQIDIKSPEHDGVPNSEARIVDVANDYEATVKAFEGCDALIHLAAIPSPTGVQDWRVHNTNVNTSFNAFRAAAELSIKRICYASSVNAIGLVYSSQPLRFDYFPIDEEAPLRPTDAYALSKAAAELQARSLTQWFPGTNIACLRIHAVQTLEAAKESHAQNPQGEAAGDLWGWVHPQAVARACLLAVERASEVNGFEIFNIVAPTTTEHTPSEQLARTYYPGAEIRADMSKNQAFWCSDKARRVLGWTHDETE